MSLTRLMVGVLTQNNNLHLVERGAIKRRKDVTPFGVAHILLPLRHKEILQLGEIRSFELRPQHLQP